jgi:hypothetical protein
MSIQLDVKDSFADAVLADVKGNATSDQSDMLKSDVNGWVCALQDLVRDVEIQFTARKAQSASARLSAHKSGDETAWLEYNVVDADWKLKANRFKASIEARLRYVKSLRVK